jgi:hypothetical protein
LYLVAHPVGFAALFDAPFLVVVLWVVDATLPV